MTYREEFNWWLRHFKAHGLHSKKINGAAYWLDKMGGMSGVW